MAFKLCGHGCQLSLYDSFIYLVSLAFHTRLSLHSVKLCFSWGRGFPLKREIVLRALDVLQITGAFFTI